MNKRTHARAYPMAAADESRALVVYFGISLLIHLIFIGSALYLPDSNPRPRLGQGAINVSLVSLPGPPAAAPAPAAATAPAPVPAPKPDAKTVVVPQKEVKKTPKTPVIEAPPPKTPPAVPKPAETLSLAPKQNQPKVKKSLKKKTQNRQKMINQALTGIQKNVENSQADSVRQALDRLKKKVAQSESGTAARTGPAVKDVSGAAAGGVSGASGSGGQRALEITDLYKIEVAFQVERHWALSQQLAGGDSRLQTKVVFRVLPSGEITDIKFTQRSGNSHLDESAYRAVVKANPVSAHPTEIRVPYVIVGLRFTPEGLKK